LVIHSRFVLINILKLVCINLVNHSLVVKVAAFITTAQAFYGNWPHIPGEQGFRAVENLCPPPLLVVLLVRRPTMAEVFGTSLIPRLPTVLPNVFALFRSGRMASSLRRRYFGRYQNVLRIILIIYASLDTAPKEASLQRLVLTFNIQYLLFCKTASLVFATSKQHGL